MPNGFPGGDALRDQAAALGQKVVENGPDAIFDEIENLLPEEWREHVRTFPLVAVTLGVGIGLWLGMRKSDEVLAAGTSLISAAAMANVSQVIDKMKGGG
ncbi:MAG: hypothetical protein JO197_11085 [Acidobacteria bacterium]|nr:hypothetical protein [Acidobacteriota bacterium]MBV9475709.1 hypothetical protein [Acidobacteriota bacterium]